MRSNHLFTPHFHCFTDTLPSYSMKGLFGKQIPKLPQVQQLTQVQTFKQWLKLNTYNTNPGGKLPLSL